MSEVKNQVESIGRKPVNTNDLRDMASEFRGTTFTELVIEAANQLDNTRTERNILRAELDAAREELREAEAANTALKDLCLAAGDLYKGGGVFPIKGAMALRLLKAGAATLKEKP
jgi:hypothetical protein